MRVVFFGTPVFAVPALRMLLENSPDSHSFDVCGVVTQPDRPSGRGRKMLPSPVKVCAQEHGIPVFQPEKIRAEENREVIDSLAPDVIVVAAYGQILPGWLLRLPRFTTINIHASLLPHYRGASPIARAILNGETVSGVTIMEVQEGLDSGPILLQEKVPIPLEMTAGELTVELSEVGARLLLQALEKIGCATIQPVPQDESRVSWAPRITKEMAPVNWHDRALTIHNQIRAMNPWPVACTSFRKERVNLWRSLPVESVPDLSRPPGAMLGVHGDAVRIQCGEGTVLDIFEMQRPARSRVSGRAFSSGARLRTGDVIFE
jgi:methionyl-tRNA formyltransferase